MRKFVKAFALAAGIFTILSTGTTVDAAQKNNRNQLYAEFLQRKYAINSGEAVTSFGLIDLDKDGQDELILNDGLTIATYYDPNNGLDEPRVEILACKGPGSSIYYSKNSNYLLVESKNKLEYSCINMGLRSECGFAYGEFGVTYDQGKYYKSTSDGPFTPIKYEIISKSQLTKLIEEYVPNKILIKSTYANTKENRDRYLPAYTYGVNELSVKVDNATYTGSAVKPKVTVKHNNTTLKEGADYKLSYSNNVNAGKGTVTVTGLGKYTGKKSYSFTINKLSLSKASVSSIKNQTYSGKYIKPSISVKLNKNTLKSGKDYTVTYSNNKNIGTATVMITGKNNCSGSKTITFQILPQTVKLTSVKSTAKKTTKVTFSPVKGNVNYEIQYATSKNGKYKTLEKTSKTTVTTKKLASKKTYYIRVRAYKMVGKKNVYGNFSKVISVKVK